MLRVASRVRLRGQDTLLSRPIFVLGVEKERIEGEAKRGRGEAMKERRDMGREAESEEVSKERKKERQPGENPVLP